VRYGKSGEPPRGSLKSYPFRLGTLDLGLTCEPFGDIDTEPALRPALDGLLETILGARPRCITAAFNMHMGREHELHRDLLPDGKESTGGYRHICAPCRFRRQPTTHAFSVSAHVLRRT